MQIHFSNLGEALAEVTAARMLDGGKQAAKWGLAAQAGRRATSEQWFSQAVKPIYRPKRKQAKGKADVTTFLYSCSKGGCRASDCEEARVL